VARPPPRLPSHAFLIRLCVFSLFFAGFARNDLSPLLPPVGTLALTWPPSMAVGLPFLGEASQRFRLVYVAPTGTLRIILRSQHCLRPRTPLCFFFGARSKDCASPSFFVFFSFALTATFGNHSHSSSRLYVHTTGSIDNVFFCSFPWRSVSRALPPQRSGTSVERTLPSRLAPPASCRANFFVLSRTEHVDLLLAPASTSIHGSTSHPHSFDFFHD